ncbi:hypothetical protein BDP55DRAFT_632474 [Colletotrichum godetiae]|uniref:Uncharacterized protein n=1 Tax=Colletotrichum godetiae TaxID=1209918 RepID=A0AAJ0EXK7_9PEZI|nr:uncharacterized protein BDP55DRAFT_632474 [Colletotrichum godetiae]KAK1675310.1 hypothetical protein BDP55DRAFT_632474 [Colletotrichum godetiae]
MATRRAMGWWMTRDGIGWDGRLNDVGGCRQRVVVDGSNGSIEEKMWVDGWMDAVGHGGNEIQVDYLLGYRLDGILGLGIRLREGRRDWAVFGGCWSAVSGDGVIDLGLNLWYSANVERRAGMYSYSKGKTRVGGVLLLVVGFSFGPTALSHLQPTAPQSCRVQVQGSVHLLRGTNTSYNGSEVPFPCLLDCLPASIGNPLPASLLTVVTTYLTDTYQMQKKAVDDRQWMRGKKASSDQGFIEGWTGAIVASSLGPIQQFSVRLVRTSSHKSNTPPVRCETMNHLHAHQWIRGALARNLQCLFPHIPIAHVCRLQIWLLWAAYPPPQLRSPARILRDTPGQTLAFPLRLPMQKVFKLRYLRAHTTARSRTLYKHESPVLGVDVDTPPQGLAVAHLGTSIPRSSREPLVSLPALGAKLCTISIARLMFLGDPAASTTRIGSQMPRSFHILQPVKTLGDHLRRNLHLGPLLFELRDVFDRRAAALCHNQVDEQDIESPKKR